MKVVTLTPEDFKQLKNEELAIYRQFLKEELWPCLQGEDSWGNAIYGAAAISDAGIPIGLALFKMYKSLYLANLLSVTIHEVGAPLLEHLEGFLRDKHCHLITYTYSDNAPEIVQLEAYLEQNEWSTPKLLLVRCYFEAHKFDAPWFKRYVKIPLPKGFEFFPWAQLKPEERELLLHKHQEGTFPISVSPFHDEKSIEPINSLGVRFKGNVVGWMITNRLNANTIVYSSFYLEPEYRETTIPLCMVAKSIYLQLHSTVEIGLIELNPGQTDTSWTTFFKNRFMPSAQHIERLYEVCKDISSKAWKFSQDDEDL